MQYIELHKMDNNILLEQLSEYAPELASIEDLLKWEIAGKYMEKYNIFPGWSGFDESGDCAYYAHLPGFIERDGKDTRLQCNAHHPLIAFWTCLLALHRGVFVHQYTLCVPAKNLVSRYTY